MMNTLVTLIKLEIIRALRNRKFMFFSVIYPSAAVPADRGQRRQHRRRSADTGLTLPTFFMVSMASFGALTAVLMGNSERIAKEREERLGAAAAADRAARPRLRPREDRQRRRGQPAVHRDRLRGRRGREGRTPGRLAVARAHRRDLGRQPRLRRARASPSATWPPGTRSARSR